MNQGHNHTAILLFTREAAEEAVVKDFAEQFKANKLIAGKMIDHSVSIIKKTGLPCFIIDSLHQHGNNFGERFTDAIEQVFLSGFDKVVVIGNDCPSLSAHDLQQAAAGLDSNDYILGPGNDGGFYLFGVCQSAFNKAELLNAQWGSENLCSTFVEYLHQQAISFSLTDHKHVIDTKQDLLIFISSKNISFAIANYLRSILASLADYISAIRFYALHKDIVYLATLRAPPQI